MKISDFFLSINEPFAAGLFELQDASPTVRYANALKRSAVTANTSPD